MKTTIQIFLILLVSQLVCAQDLKLGVCVNPQISWIKPESKNVDNQAAAMGLSGGLVMDKYFNKNYAFNFGLFLSSQAGSLKFTEPTEISTDEDENYKLAAGSVVDYRINTITIPVGLKLKTNEIGYFSYFAQIGFTNQIRLKARGTSENNDLNKELITKEIKIYNLSYHFGAGVEYALSEDTSITLGVFYNNGFLDLTKHTPKTYLRAVSLSMGVIF